MEQQNDYCAEQAAGNRGSILTGVASALIGALIGTALWAAVGILIDLFNVAVGFLISLLISKMYDLLKGRQGRFKVVCVVIAVVISVAAGTAVIYGWLLHDNYHDQIEALTDAQRQFSYIMTKEEFFRENLTNNPDLMAEMLKVLFLGLLVAGIGCWYVLRPSSAKATPASETPPQDEGDTVLKKDFFL